MNLEIKLKEIFGYDYFRNGQKQIIEQVLAGQATLGILPTGAGKSICYQTTSRYPIWAHTGNLTTYQSNERSG